ncbi:TKL/TKL-ccin protein [Salix suchowensis]|nr:TKL/TKL-ccin protein [Salix suchowensis]
MNRAIALTGASLEIAGSLSGIPFVGAAAILLNEIVACCEDIQVKKVNAQIIGNTLQRETIEFNRAHTADIQELREMIGNILTSRQDMSQVVEMQANGEHAAEIVMQAAQQELRDMREAAISHADARLELPILKTGERYLEYQRSLMNLHRITGLPPSVKILNGEITKAGDLAVAGGAYSDVWKGKWLGEEEVALKALRNVRSSDRRARQVLQSVSLAKGEADRASIAVRARDQFMGGAKARPHIAVLWNSYRSWESYPYGICTYAMSLHVQTSYLHARCRLGKQMEML